MVMPSLPKSLQLLQTTHSNQIKNAVLNLLINIAYQPTDTHERSPPLQSLLEMNLVETVLRPMKMKESDRDVREGLQQCIRRLGKRE